MIGIILLIGIVKKNAIMMTTACALPGGMPMAFGYGVGSELRQPPGIAIVGGLIVSQMLTLFTTPVIYLYPDRLSKRFSRTEPFANRPGFFIPGGAAEGAD